MRGLVMVGVVIAVSLGMCGCGGSYSSGYSGNPNSPTPPSGSGVVTVNVLAINGARSFSPNPATLPAGQMIVWHNVDNVTHRVALNDGSVDTGDLLPGASSRPMPIEAGGGAYHCSIHPVMVGSINQDSVSQQPCVGTYCE
jgi:plastocyanin